MEAERIEVSTMRQLASERIFSPEGISILGEAVRLAPSIHNTQPWRLRALPDGIEISEDPDRRLPVADPLGRERLISCGAAVFNAALAMTNLGWAPDIALVPEPAVVGRITRGAACEPDDEDFRLYAAIPDRRTHRRVFLPHPLLPATLALLYDAARRHGAWLHIVGSSGEREKVAGLMSRGTRAMSGNTAYAEEIRRWVNRGGFGARSSDGIPIASMGRGPYPIDGLSHRDAVTTDTRTEAIVAELARSTVAVLFTPRDDSFDHVSAGLALEHVLLAATSRGLAVSFANQAVERPELREELAGALGEPGHPQLLLRIGRPVVTVPATPRRPLADLFVH
jgi:nitroreductase